MPTHRAALAAVLAIALATAAAPAAAQRVPTVQALLDRHAAAVGGAERWSRIATREDVGTAVLDGASARFVARWAAEGRRWALVYDFVEDTSQVWNGYDGAAAWYESSFGDARRLTGVDSLNYALAADIAGALAPIGPRDSAVVDGETLFDGRAAWRLRIAHAGGAARTYFFEKATGLRIGEIAPNAFGARTTTVTAWRTVDGLVVPARWRVASAATTREFVAERTRFGVAVDPAVFRAPAATGWEP